VLGREAEVRVSRALVSLAALGLCCPLGVALYLRANEPSAALFTSATSAGQLISLPFVPCTRLMGSPCLRAAPYTSVASALIFDYKIPPDNEIAAEERGHVGYVWGADSPEVPGGSAIHMHYVAWAQGFCPNVGIYGKCPNGGPPSFPWLRKYHPSWILWQTNNQGVPISPARSRGDPGPIVDFTNPAVRRYWFIHYVKPSLGLGFNGIAWDNPLVDNTYGAVGHFDSHHHFMRQFTGNMSDVRWAKAQVRALGAFLRLSRAVDPGAQFAFNANFDCTYVRESLWLLLLRYVDTVVDEQGYTNWGEGGINWLTSSPGPYCINRWLSKTKTFIAMQKAGKSLVLINAEPYIVHPFMTDTDPTARADLEWSLANYFLVKYSHTYFWFGGSQQYGYPVFQQREEMVNLGRPLGDMRPGQGVYVRWFSKGVALVNPSPSEPFTVTLQTGRYEDLYGQRVNRVTMPAHSGLVLLLART
jgi:Hypothetical glycosyl hydrolase family 15